MCVRVRRDDNTHRCATKGRHYVTMRSKRHTLCGLATVTCCFLCMSAHWFVRIMHFGKHLPFYVTSCMITLGYLLLSFFEFVEMSLPNSNDDARQHDCSRYLHCDIVVAGLCWAGCIRACVCECALKSSMWLEAACWHVRIACFAAAHVLHMLTSDA
jgi:hypothetical protein